MSSTFPVIVPAVAGMARATAAATSRQRTRTPPTNSADCNRNPRGCRITHNAPPMLAAALILAASFDGAAALRHASALSALGPRPWGSPRTGAAASYIEAQLRAAGATVRLEPFESHGIRGANVIGTLKGDSPEFLVIGAHHDTAPGAVGAYDDAAGVGVMIEAARVLASRP